MTAKAHNIDLSREDGHQYAVMLWSQQASVRERWPELALLHHIENERSCTPQRAPRRKRMGVKPGVPVGIADRPGRVSRTAHRAQDRNGDADKGSAVVGGTTERAGALCHGMPRVGKRSANH